MASRTLLSVVSAFAFAAAGLACDGRFEGAGELRATKVTLQREVDGLRDTVARLERGESVIPPDDVAVAIEERLIRDIIAVQLPFDADVDKYHVSLSHADVAFQESQIIRLSGTLYKRDTPNLTANVTAIGAIDKIVIDDSTSTLQASVAVDHVRIEKAAGLESVLSRSAMDDLARAVRIEIARQLPRFSIPIQVQRAIDIPRVVAGPVRLDAASLALQVSVSRVVAGRGRLWISIRVKPGEFVRVGRR